MTSYIVYRAEQLTSLLLSFNPETEFRIIVDAFGEIQYPTLPVNPELVSFALLELISNSIRAHRERGVTEAVKVQLESNSGEFQATVLDAGRGFDPSLLPYDLNAAASDVDVMSEPFSDYRRVHGGSRFGMGLYMAKKTFSSFKLCFVDAAGVPCPWYSGKVKGTKIALSLPIADKVESTDDVESVDEVETLEGDDV
jgi:anti-sigma regulatory factor (Ser/Thr protein kinase)